MAVSQKPKRFVEYVYVRIHALSVKQYSHHFFKNENTRYKKHEFYHHIMVNIVYLVVENEKNEEF